MTERSDPSVDTELQAYVDGELDSARHDAVTERLKQDPQARRRVREYRQVNEALRSVYEPVMAEPLPAKLVMPRGRRGASLLPWVAAVAWLLVGGVAGWIARGVGEPPELEPLPVALQAIDAHVVYVPERRHAVEVGAAEKAHLNRWLSNRLQHAVASPDLRAEGFELVGGRLLPDAGRPAAQYMYEDADGERLTIYIRANPGPVEEVAFRFTEHKAVTAVYWLEDDLGYALVGRVPRERLQRVAEVVYEQLEQ